MGTRDAHNLGNSCLPECATGDIFGLPEYINLHVGLDRDDPPANMGV